MLVDQFEEVFTLCNDEAERRDFIANLLHAATVAGGRTIVVLTMRADFYPRCAAYADLAAALSDHQVLVGPMTEDELRRAIDRPARLAGLEPEPGLVELLVDDIRGRAGALPLLQFALQEVWRRREDYRLTIRTYREIGEIEGALQRKADAVYGSFTPEQQELCRRVFLRLVQPGEGSEDTRRRASLRELLPDDPAQAGAVRAIIDRLADPESRLLTTERQQTASGEGTLEVAHEALIRGWPQLRKWIETDRAGLRTHLRLTDAAKEWADAATEAKEGTLYTGARLAVASEWAASHRDELGALEAAFLSASQEHERQKKADEAEKNRRLAEAEHQRAEEAEARKREAEAAAGRQKKLSQRFLIAAAISLLLAIAAGLADLAGELGERTSHDAANKATRSAQSRRRRARRWRRRTRNWRPRTRSGRRPRPRSRPRGSSPPSPCRSGTSAWTARSSWRSKPSGPRTPSRHAIVFSKPFRTDLDSHRSCTSRRATSRAWPSAPTARPSPPDTARGGGGGVVLWDAAARKRLADEPLAVKEGVVTSVAFSPDGKTLAAGYGVASAAAAAWCCGTWPRASGWRTSPLAVKEGDVWSVAFSPDGKTLAAGYGVGGGGGGVVLWDAAARKRLAEEPLAVKEGDVTSVAFSPDGKTLAAGYGGVGGGGGGVVLWDAAARKRLAEDPLAVKEGDVESVAFSPDGKTLAAGYGVGGGGVGGVVLWDAAARKRLADEPARREGGRRHERGLQPRRQDPRRRIRRRRRRRRRRGAVGRGRAASGWRRTRSP